MDLNLIFKKCLEFILSKKKTIPDHSYIILSSLEISEIQQIRSTTKKIYLKPSEKPMKSACCPLNFNSYRKIIK